jgi:hypothetical protein
MSADTWDIQVGQGLGIISSPGVGRPPVSRRDHVPVSTSSWLVFRPTQSMKEKIMTCSC